MDKILSFIAKDMKIELSYKFSFFLRIVGLIITLSIWYFLAKWIGKNIIAGTNFKYDYFAFVLVGLASTEFQNAGLRGFADKIRQNQLTGTMEALFVSPTEPFLIVWGNTLWEFCFSFVYSLIFLLIGVVLFGVEIKLSSFVGMIVVLGIAYFAFSAIGVISASFILLFKKGDPVNYAIAALSTLLAGVYYPISILPDYLRAISNFLPVTHFLKLTRGLLLDGFTISSLWGSIQYLSIFCLVLFPLSIIAFRYAYKISRIQGTLSHY